MRWVILCLLVFFANQTAYAHNPYLLKQDVFQYDGLDYIAETHCGDGLFMADPCVFNIRRKADGAVIARSYKNFRFASFCRDEMGCQIFSYHVLAPIPLSEVVRASAFAQRNVEYPPVMTKE